MKAFQSNLSKLEGADTQVLGVSMDSPFSNFAFAQQNGVTFPLLGDFGGKVTREYGLAKNYDIQGVSLESARRVRSISREWKTSRSARTAARPRPRRAASAGA